MILISAQMYDFEKYIDTQHEKQFFSCIYEVQRQSLIFNFLTSIKTGGTTDQFSCRRPKEKIMRRPIFYLNCIWIFYCRRLLKTVKTSVCAVTSEILLCISIQNLMLVSPFYNQFTRVYRAKCKTRNCLPSSLLDPVDARDVSLDPDNARDTTK